MLAILAAVVSILVSVLTAPPSNFSVYVLAGQPADVYDPDTYDFSSPENGFVRIGDLTPSLHRFLTRAPRAQLRCTIGRGDVVLDRTFPSSSFAGRHYFGRAVTHRIFNVAQFDNYTCTLNAAHKSFGGELYSSADGS